MAAILPNPADLDAFSAFGTFRQPEDLRPQPLIERKEWPRALLLNAAPSLRYSDHVIGQGPAFYEKACAMHVEGIVSKRIGAPYTPGNRGLWRKVKCLNQHSEACRHGAERGDLPP